MSASLSAGRRGSSVSKDSSPLGRREALSLTSVSWKPRSDLDAQEWVALGHRLGKIGRASQWWIGDWIQYGNSRWGEKYTAAARITGYDVASLRNMAWVASQFDPSLRNDDLTWSHHALLAPLNRQEKEHWLTVAVENRLSVSDLRLELRASQRALAGGKRRNKPAQRSTPVVCPKCGHHLPHVSKA